MRRVKRVKPTYPPAQLLKAYIYSQFTSESFLVIAEVSTYENELAATTMRNIFHNALTTNLTETCPAGL